MAVDPEMAIPAQILQHPRGAGIGLLVAAAVVLTIVAMALHLLGSRKLFRFAAGLALLAGGGAALLAFTGRHR